VFSPLLCSDILALIRPFRTSRSLQHNSAADCKAICWCLQTHPLSSRVSEDPPAVVNITQHSASATRHVYKIQSAIARAFKLSTSRKISSRYYQFIRHNVVSEETFQKIEGCRFFIRCYRQHRLHQLRTQQNRGV
jgi:sarcosine oxidase delta subunit